MTRLLYDMPFLLSYLLASIPCLAHSSYMSSYNATNSIIIIVFPYLK